MPIGILLRMLDVYRAAGSITALHVVVRATTDDETATTVTHTFYYVTKHTNNIQHNPAGATTHTALRLTRELRVYPSPHVKEPNKTGPNCTSFPPLVWL